jgi:hypothetical protein
VEEQQRKDHKIWSTNDVAYLKPLSPKEEGQLVGMMMRGPRPKERTEFRKKGSLQSNIKAPLLKCGASTTHTHPTIRSPDDITFRA